MASKTKVELKNLKSVMNAMKAVLVDTTQSKVMLKEIGLYAENRIRSQTEAGRNMRLHRNEGGRLLRNKKLSKGYKKYRRRLKAGKIEDSVIEPAGHMRPGVSQLTLTGQLLGSLRNFVKSRSGRVIVKPVGQRERTKPTDPHTNAELTSRLYKRGRLFLGMDAVGYRVIRGKVLRVLRRNIRDFNK